MLNWLRGLPQRLKYQAAKPFRRIEYRIYHFRPDQFQKWLSAAAAIGLCSREPPTINNNPFTNITILL